MELAVPYSERGDRKLVCIVDPGRPELWYDKFLPCVDGCLKDKKVDHWIILMPSIDSDPRYYGSSFMQSLAVAGPVCCDSVSKDIRVVHRDFYFSCPVGSGFDWVPSFLKTDAKILPGSEKESMLAWCKSWRETVYDRRAGTYHAVGSGIEDADIDAGSAALIELLGAGKPADDSEFRPPSHMMTVEIASEGDKLLVKCSSVAGDLICSSSFGQKGTFTDLGNFLCKEIPKGGPPTFFHDAKKVSSDQSLLECVDQSLTVSRLHRGAEGLPGLVEFPRAVIRASCSKVNGLSEGTGLEVVTIDELPDLGVDLGRFDADIFVFAELESLGEASDKAIAKLKSSSPRCCLTMIVIAKGFESFECAGMAYRISCFIENTDLCIFATVDDLEKVKSVFMQKSCYPHGHCLWQGSTPYPRLHFHTLLGNDGKACGRTVTDDSLMFTSIKFGKNAPSLPQQKLAVQAQYIAGPDGPLHYVTLPGNSSATLISDGRTLVDIFKMAKKAGCMGDGGEFSRDEAIRNTSDLIAEYAHYLGIPIEQDEAGAEEMPVELIPDGSLESARMCVRASQRDINSVKCFARPPPSITPPFKAAAVLLSIDVSDDDDEAAWKDLQRMMSSSDFVDRLLLITPADVSDTQWSALRTLASDVSFTYAAQAPRSVASAKMTALVLALLDQAP
eukprot:TRINITY_DN17975_c0_g1_i2.p1 TRINITY_DN17975_c0_g1~~TRINITY_DN17975_c0_g1_i2.p1  ORF type:complete len:759 (-),score=126.02 TRINITY_DN17975_c0_g1_i2:326-2344(-)